MNILLTAIGCPGGPSIIESIRANADVHLIGTDMREDLPGKYLVDEFHQVPAGKSEDFIPFMLDLVKRTKTRVILPLATFELLALAQHKSEFEAVGCDVCVSDYDPLRIANDKYLLYQTFAQEPFTPNHVALSDFISLEAAAQRLGYPNEKVVIKPFISHGSIGLRIIDDEVDLYHDYLNKKPNAIRMPMALARQIFEQKMPENILVSEYLPGAEFGIDLLVHPKTHEIIQAFTRDNGDVFHSEISNGHLIDNPQFLEIARRILKELKLAYTINIDFKLDKEGQIKLLEINPRMPATSYLAYSAGFNFALASIKLALGEEVLPSDVQSDRHIYSYRGFLVRDKNGKVVYRC